MPSGLTALLDDIAMIAKLASASVDDVAAAAGRAGTKTAGVVIDDAAVTPKYVTGLSPARELPIIAKITIGSLKNKLIFLLPAALLLSQFAPWAITPILMLGGTYLAFEATEKILEKLKGDHHAAETLLQADTAEELEDRQVKGAIRTDFILSAEIMAIALAEIPDYGLWLQAAALSLVAIAVTFGVYGVVAIIVKLDDIGLHLVQSGNRLAAKFGHGLLHFVPKLLVGLSVIGTAAMLWVGGGILLHGLEDLHVMTALPEFIHRLAHDWSGGSAILEWLWNAIGASIAGIVVGVVAVALHHKIMGRYHAPGGGE